MMTEQKLAALICSKGNFLVIDGPDGSGKTTMVGRFQLWLQRQMAEQGREFESTIVREPGGTAFGEDIREVILHKSHDEVLDSRAEMLLFMAARAQLVQQVISPAMAAGKCVLSDRFVSSTLAYQGSGLGVPWDEIIAVAKTVIPARCWPTCTLILDLPTDLAASRRAGRRADNIEARPREFWDRVRQGYQLQTTMYPEYTVLVDAAGTPDETFQQIITKLTLFMLPCASANGAPGQA